MPSAEVDHIPSRALFDEKQWPAGYEFPACAQCNDVTRSDELILAFLSRLHPGETTEVRTREFRKYLESVEFNFPGFLNSMSPTHRQLREAQSKYGLKPPQGAASTGLPVLSVQNPQIHDAVANFGRKLGLALYYKHVNKILPSVGGIGLRWYANIQIEKDEIPRELANVLPAFPRIERSNRDLADQFFYRIGITQAEEMAAYLAFFRRSFAIVGFISIDIDKLKAPEHVTVLSPYSW